MSKIRTRFAPSPTGYLHIGGLRMAIFVYLLAKSTGGKAILRIEDTDKKRYVAGSVEKIIDILKWSGLAYDEGPHVGGEYGPYTQSERQAIYNKQIEKLLETGRAYRCFCSAERLEKVRAEQTDKKLPPRYDRICRELKPADMQRKLQAGETYVIRQAMPLTGEVVVKDELRGTITFNAKELDDHVLIKTDGTPTYQFAVVVDDHEMEISHVVRGEEWIPSFPKNILLYKAFGWKEPKFFHLPLTLNKGGGKLSKRQGDVTVESYIEKGYLKEALINFCILLGWHPKDGREIFTLEEIINEFNIEDMGISPAVFDPEKLDFLNGHYLRLLGNDGLVKKCLPFLEKNFKLTTDMRKHRPEFIVKVIRLERERIRKLSDISELTEFIFREKLEYPKEMLFWKNADGSQTKERLEIILKLLESIEETKWNKEFMNDHIYKYLKNNDLKIGDYLWPMRVALSGLKTSPGPYEIADVLGKEETLDKMKQAIAKLD